MFSADEELELRVGLGLVDYAGELLEGGFVDDGADEVGEVGGFADLEGGGFGDELLLEFGPDGFGDVEAGAGAALLALVFEGAADGLDGGVGDVGAGVDEMEVLAAGLADDARVALILALGDAIGDLAVQRAEDGGTAGVVQSRELAVRQHGLGDFHGITRHPLDDVRGETSLNEDLVYQPVGCNGCGGRFPDHNVTHQGGGGGKVSSDRCEVKRRDSVNETFERTVFHTAVSC